MIKLKWLSIPSIVFGLFAGYKLIDFNGVALHINTLKFAKDDSLNFTKSKSAIQELNFIINEPYICSKIYPDIFMITIVHTAPNHSDYRTLIRETWGNRKLYEEVGNVVFFALGTTSNSTLAEEILLESQTFHDIIQGDFIDSYRNLTLKAIMWMRWITEFCPQVKFVLKPDDDMLINVFSLRRYLQKFICASNTILCNLWVHPGVFRNKQSKWHVTYEEYSGQYYPDYCWGWAYIITGDFVPKMYKKSLETKFFWVDDVFVTGTVAKSLGVAYTRIASLFADPPENVTHEFQETEIFINEKSVEKRKLFWHQMERREFNATSSNFTQIC